MAAKDKKKSSLISHGTAAQNRKARFDYKIGETFEAGIVLIGPERRDFTSGPISTMPASNVSPIL
jgi:SsrA-binding protein